MTIHDSDAEIGRVLGGRYRIVAPIGVGASARVYLADDITLRRRVAVKVLHEALAADNAFLRRFRAEAQAAASVNHPHVLGVYDWGHDDVPYLVSEYLGGGSLQSMFDDGQQLTASQGLVVGLEAARGLEYAHGEGLVHRDIKPANLLFGEGGRLRIADFGLARALAEAGWTEPDGSMVGTARYAAPEQARGESVGPAADVYALALVINEAVSGRLPFTADTVIGTLMARLETPLDPHPALGPLGATVRRAGVLDPDERLTAAEFVQGFMDAAEDLPRPSMLPLVGAMLDEPSGEHTQLVPQRRGAKIPARILESPPEDEGPGRRWPWFVLAVMALIAAGFAGVTAFQDSRAVTHTVPELVGGTVEEARDAARESGWVFSSGEDRLDGSVAGEILSVTPDAGIDLEEGEILHVIVSKGEKLVIVPTLVDQFEQDAEARLDALGLVVGDVSYVENEEVEAGFVLEVVLSPGVTEVDPGTAIDLVVSEGPARREVPAVPESRDLAETRQLLTDRRLVSSEITAFSDDVAEGSVIEFRPTPGAVVPADSEVTIVVSDGPAPRAIPNTVGLTVAEATAVLEADGFIVDRVEGSPSRPVLTTNPPAGEEHAYGTEVTIVTTGV